MAVKYCKKGNEGEKYLLKNWPHKEKDSNNPSAAFAEGSVDAAEVQCAQVFNALFLQYATPVFDT